jgi:type VI secretion system protein ImpA
MSDFDAAENKVSAWVQPLSDEAAPCGPDLEYDNEFLAITQAAAGKPESQFGAAEPPNWRAVAAMAEALFERTRDLRIAILWLRAMVNVNGYVQTGPGLALVAGLLETLPDGVHPLPDPDDNDPYARVNALTVLRAVDGFIGDLRAARISDDRGLEALTGRAAELAFGLGTAREGESDLGKASLQQMMAAAVQREPALRAQVEEAAAQARRLQAVANDKLGDDAPDLKPLVSLTAGIASLLPAESVAEASDGAADAGAEGGAAAAGAPRRGLSGAVTSREEAIRAIDMVCEYLERAEPTNPAPLFLRRARQLVSHNFLQLMKVLAPDALAEVARVVGIDPDTVETPDSGA